MAQRLKISIAPLFSFILLLFAPALSSGEGRGYLELGGGYRTGDFGTDTRSDLYNVGPVLGYISDKYDASVSASYLHLRLSSEGEESSESGIGDVILRGGYVAVREGESGLSLDGALAVKLPTADESKGLGTGKTDYGGFLNLRQKIGSFKAHFSLGYVIAGDTALQHNNMPLLGVGLSRIFGNTNVYVSALRSSMMSTDTLQEAGIGAFHMLNRDYSLTGSLYFGLTNDAPEASSYFGVVRWF